MGGNVCVRVPVYVCVMVAAMGWYVCGDGACGCVWGRRECMCALPACLPACRAESRAPQRMWQSEPACLPFGPCTADVPVDSTPWHGTGHDATGAHHRCSFFNPLFCYNLVKFLLVTLIAWHHSPLARAWYIHWGLHGQGCTCTGHNVRRHNWPRGMAVEQLAVGSQGPRRCCASSHPARRHACHHLPHLHCCSPAALPLLIAPTHIPTVPAMPAAGLNRQLGLSNELFALGDSALLTVLGQVSFMPVLVLAARICPEGVEATLFATLMSILNGGAFLGSALGSLLTKVGRCLFHTCPLGRSLWAHLPR